MSGLRLDLTTEYSLLSDYSSSIETSEKEADAPAPFDCTILKADGFFNFKKDDLPFHTESESSSSSSSSYSFETDDSVSIDFQDKEGVSSSSSSSLQSTASTKSISHSFRKSDIQYKKTLLKEPLQQLNAAIKKFKEEPYKSQGYSFNRCINAVMKAYDLEHLVNKRTLQEKHEKYEETYNEKCPDVLLEDKVEKVYNELTPSKQLVPAATESFEIWRTPLAQYQALINHFSKEPFLTQGFSERRCAVAVNNAFNLETVIVTLQNRHKEYEVMFHEKCPVVALDDKVKSEYEKLKPRKMKPSTVMKRQKRLDLSKASISTLNEQLKTPVQQLKAAMQKFGEEPYKSAGYSFNRCLNAVIKVYNLEDVSSSTIQNKFENYQKTYNEECPAVRLEEKVEAAYNEIAPAKRFVAVTAESLEKLEKPLAQFQALKETFSENKGYSEKRCLVTVINAYNLEIRQDALKKKYNNYSKIFNKECSAAPLDDKVKEEYEKYVPLDRSKKSVRKTARDSSSTNKPQERTPKKQKT